MEKALPVACSIAVNVSAKACLVAFVAPGPHFPCCGEGCEGRVACYYLLDLIYVPFTGWMVWILSPGFMLADFGAYNSC